ncbi:hypothetical protein [Nocardia fusca]|uniref:Uncharacterized protein n=1 Tax=Nocardia fusca TaxID=941183 RepID=A0ABV3F1K5_9NOCA
MRTVRLPVEPEPIGRLRSGFDEGTRAGRAPTAYGGFFGSRTEGPPFVVPEGAPTAP